MLMAGGNVLKKGSNSVSSAVRREWQQTLLGEVKLAFAIENHIKDQDSDWPHDTSLLIDIIYGRDKLHFFIPESRIGAC